MYGCSPGTEPSHRTFYNDGNVSVSMLSNKLAAGHVWLLSTGNVATGLGNESLILINLNLNSHMGVAGFMLD